MKIHRLTQAEVPTVYANREQPAKRTAPSSLIQERIDSAFSKQPRINSQIATYGQQRICLLSGKNTKKLGVTEITSSRGERFRATDIERTLIDITVRPMYSGGAQQVLEAYRTAANKVSVSRLAEILAQIDYVYPCRQAVGFYLECSGALPREQISYFTRRPFEFDFYLKHAMERPMYSSDWRIYYPRHLKI